MNMSYCRFRNTRYDIFDCIETLNSMVDNDGVNKCGEKLTAEEWQAMSDILNAMADFFADYDLATFDWNELEMFLDDFK